MKKVAGLLVALVAVFSLTACGSSSKYDFTCTGKIEGSEAKISGIVKDGKVTTLVAEQTEEASSAEEAKQGAATINGFGAMGAEAGMKMTAKADGKKVIMTTEIDVAKLAANAEDSENALGVDLSNASKDSIIKAFEEQGLTCK